MKPGDLAAPDRRDIERWINEGGRLAPQAMVQRNAAPEVEEPGQARRPRGQSTGPARRSAAVRGASGSRRSGGSRVVIAGAGVAGLEALLGLRALAGDRVDITLVAPEAKFVNLSMAVDEPFRPQRVRGMRLPDLAAEFGAEWHRGALDRVEHVKQRVVTRDRQEFSYDMLVLAVGARPQRQWHTKGVLTYSGGSDSPNYRLLLHQLREGSVNKVAFVKPAGASWPLPLYDLALMTAAHVHKRRSEIELSLITTEDEPLEIFGPTISAAIRRLVEQAGIGLYTSSYGVAYREGCLELSPGERRVLVDRIVTLPRLVGPRLRGVPSDRDGFLQTDPHGRLVDHDGIFAAGDATAFPIKQGSLAAQQADAVAEVIAAELGADIKPEPFRPVLRGVLLTGGAVRYLRANISGAAGDDFTISRKALWWPPTKLSGRYLAPYLSAQTGDALDVMPSDEHTITVEIALDPAAPEKRRTREGADDE